jgi:hypothetical protein
VVELDETLRRCNEVRGIASIGEGKMPGAKMKRERLLGIVDNREKEALLRGRSLGRNTIL